jgi:hypothetical protein
MKVVRILILIAILFLEIELMAMSDLSGDGVIRIYRPIMTVEGGWIEGWVAEDGKWVNVQIYNGNKLPIVLPLDKWKVSIGGEFSAIYTDSTPLEDIGKPPSESVTVPSGSVYLMKVGMPSRYGYSPPFSGIGDVILIIKIQIDGKIHDASMEIAVPDHIACDFNHYSIDNVMIEGKISKRKNRIIVEIFNKNKMKILLKMSEWTLRVGKESYRIFCESALGLDSSRPFSEWVLLPEYRCVLTLGILERKSGSRIFRGKDNIVLSYTVIIAGYGGKEQSRLLQIQR